MPEHFLKHFVKHGWIVFFLLLVEGEYFHSWMFVWSFAIFEMGRCHSEIKISCYLFVNLCYFVFFFIVFSLQSDRNATKNYAVCAEICWQQCVIEADLQFCNFWQFLDNSSNWRIKSGILTLVGSWVLSLFPLVSSLITW